ncbi:peptidoglycan recognition protein family protein [Glycomyces xiaoerkulensis]|uniref:peptidoglycan recognition protein family protein n=1 Tax=Glycomyces xiaoerkulensis TaxID=2038139 RepID=UPI000C26120A|nr:peptidoglycan recognition family protein [Glycomyces xiaoerkulensis]
MASETNRFDRRVIRRRLLLGAGAAGLLGATGAAGLGTAAAHAAVEPHVDSTAAWGARPPRGTNPVVWGSPDKLIVHHTVSANTGDFSRARAHTHARWVQDLHMDDNGWRDSGYNFTVSRGGWITEGCTGSLDALWSGTRFIRGIHTAGQNAQSIGIANEGAYHDGAVPTAAQWEVLVTLCAYVCEKYGIPSSRIYGHKDFGSTLCPGIFHDRLPRLRSEVEDARRM